MSKSLNIWFGVAVLMATLFGCDAPAPGPIEGVTATESSLARFAIDGDELYIIDKQALRHLDISDPRNPVRGSDITVDFDVRSIFVNKGHLFLSNEEGTHIFSLANPDKPVEVANYEGINACTSTTFRDDIAFVSQRKGDECGYTEESRVSVVSFKDYSNPTTLHVVENETVLRTPYGVSSTSAALFISRGKDGLLILGSDEDESLFQLGNNPRFQAFDVLVDGNQAIVTSDEAIGIYDVSNPQDINLIGEVKF